MSRAPLVLVLGGCSGALGPGAPGRSDADGDGFAAADGDCDDRDPAVGPLAVDWPDDDVDQDCDGEDDEALGLGGVSPGDLVITEVMAAPIGVDGALGEWFEVRNATEHDLDLQGLAVRDLGTDDFLVLDRLEVDAGGEAVLAAWDDPDENGGVEADLAWVGGFGLANAGDAIRLLAGGVVLDEVAWDPTWPLEDGAALALDPDADDNARAEAWCLGVGAYGAGGYGTPGAPNPPCPPPFEGLTVGELEPGDLVITEILQNPSAVDDDVGEWIEVLNETDEPVNLDGLEVSDDDGTWKVDVRLEVAPGALVVLGAFTDGNGGAPVAAEWRFELSLQNSGDEIVLSYGTVVVDRVAWDDGFTFPDPEGASMSLDPGELDADDNDDGEEWCTATTPFGAGDLGTPGAPNPPCPP